MEVTQAGYSLDSEPQIDVTLFADNDDPYTYTLNVPGAEFGCAASWKQC